MPLTLSFKTPKVVHIDHFLEDTIAYFIYPCVKFLMHSLILFRSVTEGCVNQIAAHIDAVTPNYILQVHC